MPIYTYKCNNCGKVFDFLLLKSSEKPECPQCGSKNLEKQVTAPGSVRVGSSQSSGTTCCGRTERCDTPPCSYDGICKRG
ncbi:MAG: FmdB family zinc ribbon protein [bacterium]